MGFDYAILANRRFEMPNGWRVLSVKDVATINELSIQQDYQHRSIEYIDIASVEKGAVKSVQELPLGEAPSRAKRIVRDNDALIATVRPNLEHYAYIKKAKPNTIASTGFAVVTAKNINSRFLYYYLTTKPFTAYLTQIAESHTSAYPAFNPDVIETAQLLLPPPSEQRAIAAILGALDDKIELNQHMNETLEAITRALFKSWFVDFEPFLDQGMEDFPLGSIPTGWRVTSLGELYSNDNECVITGPFGSTLHAHDYRDSGTPLILVKHVNKGHIDETDLPLVGDHKLSELARYHLKVGDIVFTRVGAVGRSALIYPRHDGWLISGQMLRVRIRGGQVHPRYLAQLYLTDEFIDMVEAYALGTTRPSLNTTILQDFRFICPPASIQQAFAERVHPLDLKVQHNLIESQTLAIIRDTLLPKLLSGEIRVKDAERLRAEVL